MLAIKIVSVCVCAKKCVILRAFHSYKRATQSACTILLAKRILIKRCLALSARS